MTYQIKNQAVSIVEDSLAVELVSPAKTDFFIDIASDYKKANAPFYNTVIEGDFVLRCKVKPFFKNVYDAGVLLVYESDDRWIKFAFENTDLGYTSMVAVVTDNISDDSNGEKFDEEAVWLQIVRKENNWCLHYSKDKENWKMVRYFSLVLNEKLMIGVSSQSPVGDGCKVIFENLEILKNVYNDIRKAI